MSKLNKDIHELARPHLLVSLDTEYTKGKNKKCCTF